MVRFGRWTIRMPDIILNMSDPVRALVLVRHSKSQIYGTSTSFHHAISRSLLLYVVQSNDHFDCPHLLTRPSSHFFVKDLWHKSPAYAGLTDTPGLFANRIQNNRRELIT